MRARVCVCVCVGIYMCLYVCCVHAICVQDEG